MGVGVVSFGGYIPRHRLDRAGISAVVGGPAATGTRSVAGYDEDATTMAFEAGRIALLTDRSGAAVERLTLSTVTPPYLDKTNATAIHAALRLDPSATAVDMVGAVRSGLGAVHAALDAAAAGRTTLATFADLRTGLPSGADERDGGDGAAALLFGSGDDVITELVGLASATEEFLDRWRLPEENWSRVWEERFGEQVYVALAAAVIDRVCKDSGVASGDVDHLVLTGLHGRAVRSAAKAIGLAGVQTPDLLDVVGNTGTPHPFLLLADVLSRATPGQLVLVVSLSDGADAVLLRTTAALLAHQEAVRADHPQTTVRAQVERAGRPVSYGSFLSWRGHLHKEPPRREDPSRPMAPTAFRRQEWKFGFVGSVCAECATRSLPPQRVCFSCGAVDRVVPAPMADVQATVSTSTIDHLSYSPSPPVIGAVLDFDGGGRYQCELTDVDPSDVTIGTRVEMTFRRLFTAAAIHDYFWKARPVLE